MTEHNSVAIVLKVHRGAKSVWFSVCDLQIPRSSLIITVLFVDAARFCCKGSCTNSNFSLDRAAIVQQKELHG
jgi:hypothetical protein